jgi:hypothetical protein
MKKQHHGSESQIREKLCFVDGQDLFESFEFNDDDIGNQKVYAVAQFNNESVILNG